jgi:hypothetical protein
MVSTRCVVSKNAAAICAIDEIRTLTSAVQREFSGSVY